MSEESFHTTDLQQCLGRLRAGDAEARNELLLHCQERMKRLARKMLRDYPGVQRLEQTDDVLQEAQSRLVQALREAIPQSTREFFRLAAWKIRQVLLDMARRHRDRLARQESVAGSSASWLLEKSDFTHEPVTLAAWCELHEKIEQLPPDEKEIVALLYYQGLKQDDAARLLGVDTRTVQRRWSAAKVRLYDLLRGEFPSL